MKGSAVVVIGVDRVERGRDNSIPPMPSPGSQGAATGVLPGAVVAHGDT
jgi:hypothetical protein